MIDKVAVEQCVLCKSCSTACPADAIEFSKEHNGFLYPQICASRCVACGQCELVCPVLQNREEKSAAPKGYAAMNVDMSIRLSSTSGGVFWAIADYVLRSGGWVCGAVFCDDFSVKHIVTNDPVQAARMRGSKYVQSDTEGVYERVRELLEADQTVLFSGCPCQVAALKAYLKRDYAKLIAVDVICHGIPSETTWKSYLRLQEKLHGSKVKAVALRDKSLGWHCSSVKLSFANGKTYLQPITVDCYFNGFLGNVFLKESCYHCEFRNFSAGSDITLGDFWGAETALPDLDDNKGLSAVLAHTEKGETLLDTIALERVSVPIETIISGNKNLMQSPEESPIRQAYFDWARREGEAAAMEKYLLEKPVARVKRKTRYTLRRCKHWLQGKSKPLY